MHAYAWPEKEIVQHIPIPLIRMLIKMFVLHLVQIDCSKIDRITDI